MIITINIKVKKMIKIAVLGCGRIGQMHARNVSNHPDTSLAAVYDTNKEFGEKICRFN